MKKYFSVTNNMDGPISIAVAQGHVTIPALCKDHCIALPSETANKIVARLKQAYPALSMKAMQKDVASKGKAESVQSVQSANTGAAKTDTKTEVANTGTAKADVKTEAKK